MHVSSYMFILKLDSVGDSRGTAKAWYVSCVANFLVHDKRAHLGSAHSRLKRSIRFLFVIVSAEEAVSLHLSRG